MTESASYWAEEMCRLRAVKPRPLHKLYGKTPTHDQTLSWQDHMRHWNRQYRAASKKQKTLLAEENAIFFASKATP